MPVSLAPPRVLRPSLQVRPWIVVLSVAGATVLPTYLNGALTVALPTIGAKIGLSQAEWSWPITVLSLVNGAFLLISGGIADAFGRRLVFLCGTAWLMVFSLALAFVEQGTPFIAMSAVLGFGPALLQPSGTGILGESLPDGKFKNGAFAALGAGQPVGFILGLLLGGILGEQFHILYIINAAAALIFGLAAWSCLPRDGEKLVIISSSIGGAASRESLAILNGSEQDEDGMPRRAAPLAAFDWFGAVLCTAGLILFTLGIAFAGTELKGWKSVPVLSMVPVGAALMLSFFLWELNVQRQTTVDGDVGLRAPLIPPGIWAAPNFSALLATIFFSWLSFNTLTYYCTLYFQEIQHLKPLMTSVRFLPMIFIGLALNILGGVLVDKIDALWLVVSGLLGSLTSCLIYVLMHPDWSYARGMLWVMCLIVSTDIFYPAAQLFACYTVGPRRAALAGSLFNVTIRLATSVGLAATTSIAQYATRKHGNAPQQDAALAGYRAAGWFCAACTLISIILAPLTLRKIGKVGQLTVRGRTERRRTGDRAFAASRSASRTQSLTGTEAIALESVNGSGAATPLHEEIITPVERAHKRTLRADEAFLGAVNGKQ